MARLISRLKLGYYPLPIEESPSILPSSWKERQAT